MVSKSSKRSGIRRRRNHRRENYWKRYKITEREVNEYITKCCGLCEICKVYKGRRLVVDHNHESGNIRGLLCSQCNLGLGNFGDDPEVLKLAIKYLKERN